MAGVTVTPATTTQENLMSAYQNNTELASLKENLEQEIDRLGIDTVVDALAEICREKSEHVSTNWGDRNLAKAWNKLAEKLQHVSDTSPMWKRI